MDIYFVVKPMLLVSKVLCLAPFFVSGALGCRKAQGSPASVAYSLAGVSALIWIQASNMSSRLTENGESSSISSAASYIEILLATSVAALNILMSIFKTNKTVSFLDNLNRFDGCLGKSFGGLPIDFKRATWYSALLASSPIAYLLGIAGWSVGLWQSWSSQGGFQIVWLRHWATYFVTNAINIMSASQFIVYSFIISQRYALLNKKLEVFLDSSGTDRLASSAHSQSARKEDLVYTITKIKSLHSYLCDLALQLNALYDLQILFFVGVVFANITTSLNNLFDVGRRMLINEEEVLPYRLVFCGMTVYDVASLFAVVSLVALSCSSTCNRANCISVCVHSLRAQWYDREVGAALETFSLQLLHRKLTFTAFGFFPINQTMIHSFVGGVTTYLVILIQFQLSLAPASKPPIG